MCCSLHIIIEFFNGLSQVKRTDKTPNSIDQSQGIETIAQWTAYFLRAHLYQDLEARAQIYQSDRLNSLVTIISIL